MMFEHILDHIRSYHFFLHVSPCYAR